MCNLVPEYFLEQERKRIIEEIKLRKSERKNFISQWNFPIHEKHSSAWDESFQIAYFSVIRFGD